jgi:signal transduction histidine kinase
MMSSNLVDNAAVYNKGEERDIEAGTSNPVGMMVASNGNNDPTAAVAGPNKTDPACDDENTEESAGDNSSATMASQVRARKVTLPRKTFLFCGLIIILGCAATAAFVSVGITGARKEQDKQFESRSSEVVKFISSTWSSYEFAALHTHNVCRKGVTRQEFRELYEYINSTGLVLGTTTWIPNVTLEERPIREAEAKAFYAEFYPQITYRGFTGLEIDPTSSIGYTLGLRSNQSYYFPGHYIEPVLDNVGQIDYDIFSGPEGLTRGAVELALSTWKPALSPRIRIARDRAAAAEEAYSVAIMHPGVPLSTVPDMQPRDLAGIVVRIPDFLDDLATRLVESAEVYLYDSSNPDIAPRILGGASMLVNEAGDVVTESKSFVELSELVSSATTKTYTSEIDIAQRKWTVVIVAVEGSYKADTIFIILGGVIIGGCCVFLAMWLYTTIYRQAHMTRNEAISSAEKSDIMVENARKSAKIERELNDFIAHEVRNPLSAALSACAFVAAAVSDVTKSLVGLDERKTVLDDIHIIDSSLHFINDLLRNMLDMQRASSNQLNIHFAPTDILSDVVMPVDAMLYRRGSPFKVEVLCPENLIVSTDQLRLKQIILNVSIASAYEQDLVSIAFLTLRSLKYSLEETR